MHPDGRFALAAAHLSGEVVPARAQMAATLGSTSSWPAWGSRCRRSCCWPSSPACGGLGSTQVCGTGVAAVDARLSPDGRYLFVDESKADAVGAFAVQGGKLIELVTSLPRCPAPALPPASSSPTSRRCQHRRRQCATIRSG
jgi:hypothetical protein